MLKHVQTSLFDFYAFFRCIFTFFLGLGGPGGCSQVVVPGDAKGGRFVRWGGLHGRLCLADGDLALEENAWASRMLS